MSSRFFPKCMGSHWRPGCAFASIANSEYPDVPRVLTTLVSDGLAMTSVVALSFCCRPALQPWASLFTLLNRTRLHMAGSSLNMFQLLLARFI